MARFEAVHAPALFAILASHAAAQSAPDVNAPIAPDAIYVGRVDQGAGISVIDLNGFSAGTGSPRYDPTGQSFEEGWTHYPENPNVRFQGALLFPPLQPGTSNLDGGSSGVFRLTRDALLSSVLTDGTRVRSVADMMLGHSLDSMFNNGLGPDGCQSGGGNLCASTGLKVLDVAADGMGGIRPTGAGDTSIHLVVGAENPISFAPHPNPPPFVSPALCSTPLIRGVEPTSIDVLALGLVNLLVPGDPFGDPALGIPPSGLLAAAQNAWFVGPSASAASIAQCEPFMFRQQVGHFLYVADPAAGSVRVLDSNQMRLLDEIPVADPTRLAMSPELDFLAVTSRATDSVVFIDIDPGSASFHQIVQVTSVGDRPAGIAWDPANEDILVCNAGDDSLSILAAATLSVRKTVTRALERPFDVVVTQRQDGFGYERGVYFAYVLNGDGSVAVFESGPAGVNGWGYDDVLGRVPFEFRNARALQPDPSDLRSAVWIAHEGPIDPMTGAPGPFGEGALSKLVLASALPGPIPLVPGSEPHFRDMSYAVEVSLGAAELSGLPQDIAFDDQRNLGALPNVHNPFSAGAPLAVNGKSAVRSLAGALEPASTPQFLFVATRGSGGAGSDLVDVIELASFSRFDTNPWQPGTDSIPAAGVRVLMSYFRQ